MPNEQRNITAYSVPALAKTLVWVRFRSPARYAVLLHGAECGEVAVLVQDFDGAEADGAQQFGLVHQRLGRVFLLDVIENLLAIRCAADRFQMLGITPANHLTHRFKFTVD